MYCKSQLEITFVGDCYLGSGYIISTGTCEVGSPFEDVGSCNGSGLEPCEITTNVDVITSLSRSLTSSQETQQETAAAVSASGGGWGVHASVSVNEMSKCGASSTSISFVKSEIFDTVELSYKNVNNLKLTEGAKSLLGGPDPLNFLTFYGTGFVFNIAKSATFFGSVYVSTTKSSSSDSLSAVATASYDGGVFSVKGSAEFSKQMSEHSQNLETYGSGKTVGGLNISSDFSTPNEVQVAFDQWSKSVNQNPEGNSLNAKMMLQSWLVCDEITNILAELNNDTVTDLFKNVIPTPNTMTMITQEWVLSMNLLKTAGNVMAWGCVKTSNATYSAVIHVQQDISTHVTYIESMDGRAILQIQEQIKKSDWTFFKATYDVFSKQLAKAHDTDDCKSQCTCLHEARGTGGLNEYQITNGSILNCQYWETCIMRDSTCHCEVPLFDCCQCFVPPAGAPGSIECFYYNGSLPYTIYRPVIPSPRPSTCPNGLSCSEFEVFNWFFWKEYCVLPNNTPTSNLFLAKPAFIGTLGGVIVLLCCLLIYWHRHAERKSKDKIQHQLAEMDENAAL